MLRYYYINKEWMISNTARRVYRIAGCHQDFLRLWKDADADIAILKQAKVEYAKLR